MSAAFRPSPAQPALSRGQKSHPNGIDPQGRGRSLRARRRVQTLPIIEVSSHATKIWWAELMARRCGTRENCAAMFKTTFQTACNWFDGFSCPTGDKVRQAALWWPEEFAGP